MTVRNMTVHIRTKRSGKFPTLVALGKCVTTLYHTVQHVFFSFKDKEEDSKMKNTRWRSQVYFKRQTKCLCAPKYLKIVNSILLHHMSF